MKKNNDFVFSSTLRTSSLSKYIIYEEKTISIKTERMNEDIAPKILRFRRAEIHSTNSELFTIKTNKTKISSYKNSINQTFLKLNSLSKKMKRLENKIENDLFTIKIK